MELLWPLLVFIGAFALYTLYHMWGGKCKHCGSWWTGRSVHSSLDDHQPHLRFVQWVTECPKCGAYESGPQQAEKRE